MKYAFFLFFCCSSLALTAQTGFKVLPRVKDTATLKISPAAQSALSSSQRIWLQPASRPRHTATAQWIGSKLNKEVYRVDLSAVVSKYIGETEKNLNAIFDKAASMDIVLFFDEADALFGKRTGVQDAHDKYANQEVSYFLQRLEKYQGMVLVATNYGERLKGFVKLDP